MVQAEKIKIKERLQEYCNRLGSQSKAVGSMTGVSTATMSKILNNDWDTISDSMWRNIAAQIGYNKNSWQVAETRGYKMMYHLLSDAQGDSLVLSIIGSAGSGKTEAIKRYTEGNSNVFHLSCSEYWNRGAFMGKLLKAMGQESGDLPVREQVDLAIEEIKRKETPLIILDEADKLTDQVLYFFITLYNQLEDRCGIVLCATSFLEKRLHKGLRLNRKGYEEIYSRMGRKFIELPQISIEDIEAICLANGIEGVGDRKKIIDESEGDLRRVKRLIWAIQKRNQA